MHYGPTWSPQPWKMCICLVWSILFINLLKIFFDVDPLPFRHLSELEFQLLTDFARWKSGQRKEYGAVLRKNWLKLNITIYLILFKYISHFFELEFFILCDCTNQKRKTIERCVKERLEKVVRVQLWRDLRTRECSRVIIELFHANYLAHLKD